jgi:hypothetical protein
LSSHKSSSSFFKYEKNIRSSVAVALAALLAPWRDVMSFDSLNVAVRRIRRGTLANESSDLSLEEEVTSRNDMVRDSGFAGIMMLLLCMSHRGLEMGLDSGVDSSDNVSFSFPSS